MANQNFVVHNGLTVGQTTIDAATSNISLPVGKQMLIGNVIMRDNGDGRVTFRDATDNSDAVLVATISSPSVTQGNIQIGTNHIESINANGPISIRPNGDGPVGLFANTITFGKGTGQVTFTTGAVLDPIYGVNYPGANIIIATGNTLTATGNVRIAMPSPSTNTDNGSFQVLGGVGIKGNLNVGVSGAASGAFHNIVGNIAQTSAGGAVYFNTTGNIIATTGVFSSLQVNSGGTANFINTTGNISASTVNAATVNISGNVIATTAKLGSVEAAGVIYANGTAVSTSTTSGALIVAGGAGIAGALYVGGNVVINGNLFVNGNVTTINANNLNINDSMIYLADDNPADILDIGFVSSFTSGAGYQHTGFVRDASDGLWKLFAGVATEPTTTIDFTGATYSSLYVGNIQTVNSANIGSTLNVAGNILAKTATLGATTVNGGITSTGFINTTSNVSGAVVLAGTLTTTGTLTAGQINTTGNVLSAGAVHNSLTVNGATTHAGTTALQGTSTTQIVQPDGDNTRTLGASGVRWSTVYGVTFSGTSTTANYADLAEKYQADAEYAPGTVLEFGGDQEVTLAEEGTRRVAGVVSTNPAHLMNDLLVGENTVALALTGRVPVKVTGYIRKGDMLVSAGDGRARASAMPQIGTVIGKALQDFDGSDGVIEVVVGRL